VESGLVSGYDLGLLLSGANERGPHIIARDILVVVLLHLLLQEFVGGIFADRTSHVVGSCVLWRVRAMLRSACMLYTVIVTMKKQKQAINGADERRRR
jgi:hypothetical protein